MRLSGVMAMAVLAAGAVPATAMMCTEALPPALASWVDPLLVQSGATIPVGRAVRGGLVAGTRFAVPPAHAVAAGTPSATYGFAVKSAGVYRVSLGSKTWIDVVGRGKAVAAIAHKHGGECSPVQKQVDFRLAPGRYTLQLSGGDKPVLTLMIGKV